MSPIESFGICLLISCMLFVIPYLIFGEGVLLLIVIFPAMIAETITGERGLGFGRKSFSYLILLFLFIFLQVLVLAMLFFGFYCLFWGYPIDNEKTVIIQMSSDANKISLLLVLNKLLLLFLSYFLCRFIYQLIKYRNIITTQNIPFWNLRQALHLAIFPLAYIYLIASLYYLINYPNKETLGTFASIAGCIYAVYLIYGFGRTIFFYMKSIRQGFSGIPLTYILQLVITLLYNCTFLYFFYQTFSAIKIH